MSYALRVLRAVVVLGARSRKAQAIGAALAVGALVLLVRAGSGDSSKDEAPPTRPLVQQDEMVAIVRTIHAAAKEHYERTGELCASEDWTCLGLKRPVLVGFDVGYHQGAGYVCTIFGAPDPTNGFEAAVWNGYGCAFLGSVVNVDRGVLVNSDLYIGRR